MSCTIDLRTVGEGVQLGVAIGSLLQAEIVVSGINIARYY